MNENARKCPHGFTKNTSRLMRAGGVHCIRGQKIIRGKIIESTTSKQFYYYSMLSYRK